MCAGKSWTPGHPPEAFQRPTGCSQQCPPPAEEVDSLKTGAASPSQECGLGSSHWHPLCDLAWPTGLTRLDLKPSPLLSLKARGVLPSTLPVCLRAWPPTLALPLPHRSPARPARQEEGWWVGSVPLLPSTEGPFCFCRLSMLGSTYTWSPV